MLRTGPLMALPAVLRSFGADPARLLAEFGLDAAFFDDPENTLSITTAGRIFGRCVELTGCRHFGLLIGQQAGHSSLGAVGFLMQSSEDVGIALEALARDLNVQDRAAVVSVENDGKHVVLSYTVVQPGVEHLDQILAVAIAAGLNIMRALCGPQWCPDEVRFAFARPAGVEPYRRFFHMLPRFDAEQSALVFPAGLLRQPLPGADPILRKLMEDRIRELQLRADDDLLAQLRRLLRVMITSPDCSLAAVARRIGVHGRTLNRELAAQGTSFLRLREETRYGAACQLLEKTRTPAWEIAAILGYTSASAFTRAFRRWSGAAPAEWRASRAHRPPRLP